MSGLRVLLSEIVIQEICVGCRNLDSQMFLMVSSPWATLGETLV